MAYFARYNGTCTKCHNPITKGQAISWTRTKGAPKAVYHLDCSRPEYIPEIPVPPVVEVKPAPEPTLETTWLEPRQGQDTVVMLNMAKIEQNLKEKFMTLQKPITVEETELAPIAQIGHKHAPDKEQQVKNALEILLAAMEPKEPTLDETRIKSIARSIATEVAATVARDVVTEAGAVRYEFVKKDAPPVTFDLAHKSLPLLVDYLTQGEHVYLYGQHGSGKSTGAQQAAQALGREYGYISLTPQTPESRLLGYMTANGGYSKTPFREAYELGWIFCIDELDNASPALLTTLNGALENGHMAFPDGLISRHENFVLVGTGNTSGKGANPSYPERRPFDSAFGDRFQYIQWEYDRKLERKIALAFNPNCEDWVTWVHDVRKWAEKNHPRFVPSPRATIRIAKGLAAKRDIDVILDSALWRGDSEIRTKVLANCPIPQ